MVSELVVRVACPNRLVLVVNQDIMRYGAGAVPRESSIPSYNMLFNRNDASAMSASLSASWRCLMDIAGQLSIVIAYCRSLIEVKA